MKCDELKAYNVVVTDECADYICGQQQQLSFEAYAAEDVDAAIAELKAKLYEAEEARIEAGADAADYYQENRRLKRALWLSRAERAHAEWGHWATIWFCDTHVELNIDKSSVSQEHHRCTTKRNAAMWRNIWSEVERKCRAKAKEFE